ncbi:MAG: enoyl-CoA hydratase [Dehalococcoidia bacterium]
MAEQDILYEIEDGVGTITLNRPQSLNAITEEMLAALAEFLEESKRDPNVKVLVLTGAGRAFCAGANPRKLDMDKDEELLPFRDEESLLSWGQSLYWAFINYDKPLLAAVNGPAAGGGMDLATSCDIRIASDKAKFRMAFVRMGVTPSGSSAYWLPRLVGLANAYELIWTGKVIDAQEAYRIGYVNRVVPHDELMATTRELALTLAKGPTVAIRLSKRLIRQCLNMDVFSALGVIEAAEFITENTEDAKEGPRAWVEKREPQFKGR